MPAYARVRPCPCMGEIVTYERAPIGVPETDAQYRHELCASHQEEHELEEVAKLIEQHLHVSQIPHILDALDGWLANTSISTRNLPTSSVTR